MCGLDLYNLKVVEYSLQMPLLVTAKKISNIEKNILSSGQLEALRKLEGYACNYSWELEEALSDISPEWVILGGGLKNKLHDRSVKQKLAYLHRIFQWREI